MVGLARAGRMATADAQAAARELGIDESAPDPMAL
jgi:hypothetical protein